MTLGEWLEKRRTALGFPQGRFATMLGISRVALWKREKGKSIPPIGDAARLARSYRVPAADLRARILKALELRTRGAA